MRTTGRLAASLTAGGVALAGLAVAPLGAASAAPVPAVSVSTVSTGTVATSFGMEHHAFGTKVDGNATVRSGPTANSIIACTTLAGLVRQNYVAAVDAASLVTADEVRSKGFTTKVGGVVSVTSRNTITSGSLLGGDVRFRGLSSQSRTWHDADGFHNEVTQDLARLAIGGDPVTLNGGQESFPVPGGTLTVFSKSSRKTTSGASARGLVLLLKLDDGTRVQVGSSYSRMLPKVFGPLSGSTWGSQVTRADNTAGSGRTAFQVMPCQGTGGEVRENATTGITVPDAVSTSDIATHLLGIQGPTVQRGYTQAQIAQATLGTLGFTAEGIVSKANVERDNGALIRDAKGTRLLSLQGPAGDITDQLAAGEAVDVAGLGTVTYKKVQLVRNGIDVVALDVVLTDGTHIELGHSIMRIKKN